MSYVLKSTIKYLPKVLIMLTFIYLLSFSIFQSCVSIKDRKESLNHLKVMDNILLNSRDTPYPNQNFIFLKKGIQKKKNGQICSHSESDKDCTTVELFSTASGTALFNKGEELYILTASHWCEDDINELQFLNYLPPPNTYDVTKKGLPKFKIEVDFYGESLEATVIKKDKEKDLCMLKAKSRFAYKIDPIKLAKKMPKIGDDVYTISAPLGVSTYKTRLHFQGKFSGCDPENFFHFCYYTIPAIYGSSGSSILNKDGELIGIISIAMVDFNSVSGGAGIQEIKEFLSEYY